VAVGTNGIEVIEQATNYFPAVLSWTAPQPLTGWTHIVVVYRNRTPELYVNGKLVRTGLQGSVSAVHPGGLADLVSVGGIGGHAYGYYQGLLDQVRYWNRALSSAEIQRLAAGEDPRPSDPALVAEWRFAEGAGTVAEDTKARIAGVLGGGDAAAQPLWVANVPPSAGGDRIVVMQQDGYATIRLAGFDPDRDPVGFLITTIPGQGKLYQTPDGVTLGAPITSPGTAVENPYGDVIFVPAAGQSGAPYASFGYVVHDGRIGSPEAKVTIHVVGRAISLQAWSGAPYGAFVGSQASLVAEVQDAAGNPLSNVLVRFAVQTSPYATFISTGTGTIDVYTNASGRAEVRLTDPYAEAVDVQVSLPTNNLVLPVLVTQPFVGTKITAAQANISGANCNAIWSQAGSPYLVQASVSVAAGCSLTIQPGVVVKFAPGTGINVQGSLSIGAPNAAQLVVLTSANDDGEIPALPGSTGVPVSGEWLGLSYGPGAKGSVDNAEIRYAWTGLDLFAPIPVSNLNILYSGSEGLWWHALGPAPQTTLSNVFVEGGIVGIRLEGSAPVQLVGATVRSADTGVHIIGGVAKPNVRILGSFLVNNATFGIYTSDAGSAEIVGNLLRGNGDGAVLGGAIAINPPQNPPVFVANNLIVENTTPAAVAVFQQVSGATAIGAQADLYSNTIADNTGDGVFVYNAARVALVDNIVAANGGSQVVGFTPASFTLREYNYLSAADPYTAPTDIYGVPLGLKAGWYLGATSPALNADATRTAAALAYMPTNPYAQPLAVDVGALDLGWHNSQPAPVIDPVASRVHPAAVYPDPVSGVAFLVVEPMTAAGYAGPGLRLRVLLDGAPPPAANGTFVSRISDLGNGIYLVQLRGGAPGTSNLITIEVEDASATGFATLPAPPQQVRVQW